MENPNPIKNIKTYPLHLVSAWCIFSSFRWLGWLLHQHWRRRGLGAHFRTHHVPGQRRHRRRAVQRFAWLDKEIKLIKKISSKLQIPTFGFGLLLTLVSLSLVALLQEGVPSRPDTGGRLLSQLSRRSPALPFLMLLLSQLSRSGLEVSTAFPAINTEI